jgi:hypothetical protein
MRPQRGLAQNIDALCFAKGAVLRDEFDNLYHSLFKNPENHIAIVRALSTRGKGMAREDLAKASGVTNGGGFTHTLEELELSGFIRKYPSFDKKVKGAIWQLMDPFTMFYLRFMDDARMKDPHFWSSYTATPAHNNWSGHAFEIVCMHHMEEIRRSIGIGGVLVDYSAWFGEDGGEKAQIDLAINRADGVISLCEMKYSNNVFTVSEDYERELREKRSIFARATKTKKALSLVLVTTYGLKRNAYADIFNNTVTMDDLFV